SAPAARLAPAAQPAETALPASALRPSAAPADAPQTPKTSPGRAAAPTPAPADAAGPRVAAADDKDGVLYADAMVLSGSLQSLGVPEELTSRLTRFLDSRHPGHQDRIYHGTGHSYEVANVTARMLEQYPLPASRKILLILAASLHDIDPARVADTPARVPATIKYLDEDSEARSLVSDFASRYGFTAEQVGALILATDFSPDAAEMLAKRQTFEFAAAATFPGEDFGKLWGLRLAYIDQASTYLAGPTFARNRVAGLAHEIRTGLDQIGKGPGPTDEQMLAGTAKFLTVLRQNPNFDILPPELKKRFETVSAYFERRQTPEAWAAPAAPAPARAPPASPELEAAKRYVNSIASGIQLTERQTDGLLAQFFEDRGIAPGSPQADAVRRQMLPGKVAAEDRAAAGLSPSLKKHRSVLLKIAADRGTSPAAIEAVLARRGVLSLFAGLDDATFHAQVERALDRNELEAAVSGYPDNAQGDFMRRLAGDMATPSGKSIEETSRSGVFAYVDFSGSGVSRASTGRDPDVSSVQMLFYVTRAAGRWKIGGYRQNKRTGRTDAELTRVLRQWLVAGGIPARDLE
ncbi:MAG: HD domain-containing protein, partial [Elusimicrobiota bacterium]